MNGGFQKLYFIIISLLSITQIVVGQNSTVDKDTVVEIEIFEKEETEYIGKWIEDLLDDAGLDAETINRFTVITSYYGLKMKQLGEDPKLTKIEVIDSFNSLVKKQNKELKQILPTEQFESFSKFYDKLSWSVNKRLNQL